MYKHIHRSAHVILLHVQNHIRNKWIALQRKLLLYIQNKWYKWGQGMFPTLHLFTVFTHPSLTVNSLQQNERTSMCPTVLALVMQLKQAPVYHFTNYPYFCQDKEKMI